MVDFIIAHNPDPDSSLPYLLRVPFGSEGIALKARETWPRTTKVYCHRADEWPADLDVIERVPVRSCRRRGVAIDLVLDRHREKRSQFVFTKARGREVIFWQSARTAKQARPGVVLPTARASGQVLEIVVDSGERYAWKFEHQQANTVRRKLPAGDYAATVDGQIVAAVERKSLADLVSSLTGGKLRYQMAELTEVSRAAVVVEDRWGSVFKLDRVRPSVVTDGLAELQVRFPTVPIVFADNRRLAQEWTYRFLGAAISLRHAESEGMRRAAELPPAGMVPPEKPTTKQVREWALAEGLDVSPRGGRISAEVWAQYEATHRAR